MHWIQLAAGCCTLPCYIYVSMHFVWCLCDYCWSYAWLRTRIQTLASLSCPWRSDAAQGHKSNPVSFNANCDLESGGVEHNYSDIIQKGRLCSPQGFLCRIAQHWPFWFIGPLESAVHHNYKAQPSASADSCVNVCLTELLVSYKCDWVYQTGEKFNRR